MTAPPTNPPRKRIYHIVGEAQTNPDGKARQSILADLWPGDVLDYRREADNPYDANAVLITDVSGQALGYIPRDAAATIAPVIDAGHNPRVHLHRINGGVTGFPNIGIEIAFTWPGQSQLKPTDLDDAQLAFRNRKQKNAKGGCAGAIAAFMATPIGLFYFVELFS